MNNLADRIQKRLAQKKVVITLDEAKDIEDCFQLMYDALPEERIQECIEKARKQKKVGYHNLSTKKSPCYFKCQTQTKEFYLTLKLGKSFDLLANIYWDLKQHSYGFKKGQTGCIAEPLE